MSSYMKGVYDMNQLHRRMGTFSLMMVGLGSMIGSGWLFGAWRAAQIAGPAAIISWVIGMVVILFIALSYSELGSMFPEAGNGQIHAIFTRFVYRFYCGLGQLDCDCVRHSG